MKLSKVCIFRTWCPGTPRGSVPPICLTLVVGATHITAAPISPSTSRSTAGGTMFNASRLSSW